MHTHKFTFICLCVCTNSHPYVSYVDVLMCCCLCAFMHSLVDLFIYFSTSIFMHLCVVVHACVYLSICLYFHRFACLFIYIITHLCVYALTHWHVYACSNTFTHGWFNCEKNSACCSSTFQKCKSTHYMAPWGSLFMIEVVVIWFSVKKEITTNN